MRVVLQRVSEASVAVEGEICGRIGRGLLVLAGIAPDDTGDDRKWIAQKILALRIFPDEQGVMNRAVGEIGGELLAVSQFTLFASTRKGNRPSWSGAAAPATAESAFAEFVALLARRAGRAVPTGRFGADMQVALVNDGPVTILLDSKRRE